MLGNTAANNNLISELKDLREQVSMLKNMFASVERFEKVAIKASKRIDSILYELTGDEFYHLVKNKHGGKQ